MILRGHQMGVWSMAFDASGSRLVTGSPDGSARVWNTDDGSQLAELSGHDASVWDVGFLPDGRVLTVSEDKTLRVWSLDASIAPLVLSGHEAPIMKVVVSPEGSKAVSVSADTTARLWDLDLLMTDPELIQTRLTEATNFCLPITQRMDGIGQDLAEATAAFEACERSYGRR
jgi:WD40 repeat protein